MEINKHVFQMKTAISAFMGKLVSHSTLLDVWPVPRTRL